MFNIFEIIIFTKSIKHSVYIIMYVELCSNDNAKLVLYL